MTDKPVPEGYRTLEGLSPAEDHIGPFYYLKSDAGLRLGFRPGPLSCNGLGTVHGGILMAFADYAVTMLALSGVRENCTTVSFTSHFIASARSGDWIEAQGDVVKRTGSMTFVDGTLNADDAAILSFQAVVKRLRKPDQAPA
ncbi:MAG: PaaI family thioesterase [Pseudomonadota bacterium]